jgi:hypothetical protein
MSKVCIKATLFYNYSENKANPSNAAWGAAGEAFLTFDDMGRTPRELAEDAAEDMWRDALPRIDPKATVRCWMVFKMDGEDHDIVLELDPAPAFSVITGFFDEDTR